MESVFAFIIIAAVPCAIIALVIGDYIENHRTSKRNNIDITVNIISPDEVEIEEKVEENN